MFSKNRTAIFSLLFFVSIGSQIMNAGKTKAFPDLRPTDNPLIHMKDPQPAIRELDFSRDDEPILRWCAPTGLGLNQSTHEIVRSGNSYEIITRTRVEDSDECTPASDLTESIEK